MQLANCLLSIGGDDGNTVPKFGVTAAEIPVLQRLHGEAAVKDIEPAGEVQRTHREELARLHERYGKVEGNPVAALYPGAAARVFERLDELAINEQFFKPIARTTANTTPAPAAEVAALAPHKRGRPAKRGGESLFEDTDDNEVGDLPLAN